MRTATQGGHLDGRAVTRSQSPIVEWQSWRTVAILMSALFIALVDRTIVGMLVVPIQRDLKISDTEFGFLQGPAFGLFFCIFGLPMGYLVDAIPRRRLISVAILTWSIATAACGLSRLYWELFIARMLVGVGEAALIPAGLSLLADIFPPNRLSRAVGVFSTGSVLGSGAAFLFGGIILSRMATAKTLTIPIVGALSDWHVVFLSVAWPGILIALLVLGIKEPRRAFSPIYLRKPTGRLFGFVRANRLTLLCHFGANSCIQLSYVGFSSWLAALFLRTKGLPPSKVGLVLALLYFLAPSLGLLLGGMVADKWLRANRTDAHMRLGMWASVGVLPFAVCAPLVSGWLLAAIMLFAFLFFLVLPASAAMAGLQLITPSNLRGTVSAIYMLVVSVFGAMLGPVFVGLLTDRVLGDPARIGFSLSLVGGTAATLACALFFIGRRPFGESLERNTEAERALQLAC